jgi:hypothetical protein
LEAAAKSAYVDAMSVSLVAAGFVVVATAVMVRRFYPDQLVMHDAAHGPASGATPDPIPAESSAA